MEQKYENYKIKKMFLNMLLKKGKKNISEKLYNNILMDIKKKTKQNPNNILFECIENLSPKIKIINIPNDKRKKKKKDQYYLIFLEKEKQIKISLLWVFKNLKNISKEIIDTSNNKSKSIDLKKKMYEEINKLHHNIKFK